MSSPQITRMFGFLSTAFVVIEVTARRQPRTSLNFIVLFSISVVWGLFVELSLGLENPFKFFDREFAGRPEAAARAVHNRNGILFIGYALALGLWPAETRVASVLLAAGSALRAAWSFAS